MDFNRTIRGLWGIVFLILVTTSYAKDVTLAWDHDGNCTEYRVYRGFYGETGQPQLVGVVPCPTKEFTDVNIPHGDLTWVVTAFKEIESNASNEERYAYYYPRVKYDTDAGGHILYKGENANYSAIDDDTTWVITKYYYDVKWRVMEIRVKEGSWTNRNLGW